MSNTNPDTGSALTDDLPLPASSEETARLNWVAYGLLGVICFLLGWLGMFGWQQRTLIAELFYQSSMARYGAATGEAGPATFYVFHDNFVALETIAQANDEILGIELTEFSGVAAMAFVSLDADAIADIRNHRHVKNMVQKNIPMICH